MGRALTKTPKRATNGVPKSEQQTDGREGFFTTAECLCIFVTGTLSLGLVVRLHPQLKLAFLVIEKDFAVVATVRQMILEDHFATESDMTPEFLPFGQANVKRRPQSLKVTVRLNRGDEDK